MALLAPDGQEGHSRLTELGETPGEDDKPI